MKTFFAVLPKIRGGSAPNPISPELYDVELRLQASNLPMDSFYFFRRYLSSEYSLVQCDKKYFFMWSTDHSTGSGGIYWGKGDNKDLSDFTYGGFLFSGDQAETPFLLQRNNKLFLYYHTDSSETGNDSKQQTRLKVYEGGVPALLHEMTFVDYGRPLGIVGDENHTGYFNPYERQSDIIGLHIGKGGLPQPAKSSVSTDGGYTYSRVEEIDTITGIEENYFAQVQEGRYFTFQGQQFWLGQIHPQLGYQGASIWAMDKKIIVAKADYPYGSVTQLAQIYPEFMLRNQPCIEGTTADFYFTRNKGDLYHGKYDLNNLYQWL